MSTLKHFTYRLSIAVAVFIFLRGVLAFQEIYDDQTVVEAAYITFGLVALLGAIIALVKLYKWEQDANG